MRCLIVFLFLPVIVHAQIQKCTLPNGKVEYTDQPCTVGAPSRVEILESTPLDHKDVRRAAETARREAKASIRPSPSTSREQSSAEKARAEYEYRRFLCGLNKDCLTKVDREFAASNSKEFTQQIYAAPLRRRNGSD